MKFFYNKEFNRLEIYFDNKTNVNGLYWDNVWNENNAGSAMSEIFWFIFLEFVDFF